MKSPTLSSQKNLHFSLRVTVWSHIRFVFYFLRYITVVYFLNDVDDGGEVVFPLANSKFEVFRLTPPSCVLFVCLLMYDTELTEKPQAAKAISL